MTDPTNASPQQSAAFAEIAAAARDLAANLGQNDYDRSTRIYEAETAAENLGLPPTSISWAKAAGVAEGVQDQRDRCGGQLLDLHETAGLLMNRDRLTLSDTATLISLVADLNTTVANLEVLERGGVRSLRP
ncbi:hypothetical protein [Rhodococcoides kroppenstedtii]|uniref:hypothetical protein n=1 Tax=Rhodococcoides kroppenstedtii TaxID=293050 RepID=UPI001427C0DE|nr:hypothetical protein [Rhodococcus kroppenstedtii]NIL81997.1 hypothetical protein [Rhodococcus kroppenstedtii]